MTLPILFLTCLEIRMPVFPDILPCAGIAVLHTLQHLWVLLDTVLCPQRGGTSPFPHPRFSVGLYPLILYPEDVSPELFAVGLAAIPVPSDYLAHGDGDQSGHRADWVVDVTGHNGIHLIFS